jgi:hypothetical protein
MSDDEMDRLIQRQGELTELLEHHDAWELDTLSWIVPWKPCVAQKAMHR